MGKKQKNFVTQAKVLQIKLKKNCSFEKRILMICKYFTNGEKFSSSFFCVFHDQIFINQTLLFDVVYGERECIMSSSSARLSSNPNLSSENINSRINQLQRPLVDRYISRWTRKYLE